MIKKSGFTLIEIMVATTIFAIAIVMVTASFGMANKWQKQVKANREIAEAGRFAMEKISRDIRTAEEIKTTDTGVYPGKGLGLEITNNGKKIKYQVDNINQKLLLKEWDNVTNTWSAGSEVIDATKVIVKNEPDRSTRFFAWDQGSTDHCLLIIILADKKNPSKETIFKTLVTKRYYYQ